MLSTRNKVLDKNKVFFGLIHYILSEQKNVNWLIKSSLIDITGVNSTLMQKPFKSESILNDVVDFIKEIKPYHTQFSDYFEQYETATENINIPKNDWISPTIGLRFDAIKSSPDINKIFYEVVNSLPTDTDTDTDINQYNKDGLTIFNKSDNKFYIRNNNGEWFWETSDEKLLDNGAYCTSSNKKMFSVVKINDTNILTLNEFTKNDKNEFVKHRANRLFYMNYLKKIDYETDYTVDARIKIFDDIKKDLNANFKGLTVDGGIFDIGNFGYDIFNYDTYDYDSPTVIYDYYFVKYYEDIFKNSSELFPLSNDFNINDKNCYQKSIVNFGEHKFTLNLVNNDTNTSVYKVSNGVISEYYDYNISIDYNTNTNYIDIFSPLSDKEKIYVVSYQISDLSGTKKVNKVDVIEASSFIPSKSEIIHREIVYLTSKTYDNIYKLRIPIIEVNSTDKISIQKETNLGRKLLSNIDFTYLNGEVIIDNGDDDNDVIEEYNHIIMTQFDYKYLYDKVYMWEDRYGRSNNVVNLTGDRFLRSRYEEDRPSEKVVSYPQSSLFGYLYNTPNNENPNTNPDTLKEICRNDYKNDFTNTNNLIFTEISSPPELDENNMIKKLYVKNNFGKKSGKILINSEIIEYKESIAIPMTNNNGETIISEYELNGLSRGVDGTTVNAGQLPKYKPHKLNIEVGDIVFLYEDKKWKQTEKNYLYKSYNINNPDIRKYNCPSGYNLYYTLENTQKNIDNNNYIYAQKLSKINLLNDITKSSTTIDIDSPNIVSGLIINSKNKKLPIKFSLNSGENGESYTNKLDYYYLKINDDIIKFKTITKINDLDYRLSNIVLPEKYNNYDENEIIYKNSIEYPNDTFIYSSYPENISYNVEIVEGKDFEYDIISDVYDENIKYIQMNSLNGYVDLYKIENNNIYLITYSLTEPLYEEKDILFGKIIDGYAYKNNGEIYAKIDDNKFKSVEIIITIDDNIPLYKGESLLIKVLN